LHIELFGAGHVQIGGEALPPLKYRKEFWLLAYLALHSDRDLDRDAVAALFWPDNEEELARYYLRRSLSHLRRALGPEAHRLLTPAPRTLRLDLTDAFCDVVVFDHAVTSAAPGSLEQAVAWYRGPLLPGCPDAWVVLERQRREHGYLEALETLAQRESERGEAVAASRLLRLLITADPYRESAVCSLMQALADSGDRAAMQQVYQDLRRALRRDLNIDPAPETQALYQSLHERAPQPVVLPPAAMPSGPPRRLPVPLSNLIGREQELEEVCGWLGKNRLVTLAGTGGVGKTRLSLAAAVRVIGSFADGVWFVDLAPLNDPAFVTQALLRLFDLREEPHTMPEEILERTLSSRALLLVLDNCEHLLEASASLTDRLLSACPGLKVLATSREALGLAGEHLYRVPSLSLPPAGQPNVEKSPFTLLEYEAVRLFVERARQSNSSFQLTRRNAALVVQICHRLDGIPLAIEMAAARLKALSAAQIAARLEDRFRLLTGGSRAALPRQRTLQAAIDWSHDLLTEEERILFRRLSVFAGGWSLEAAEAVCTGEDGAERFPPNPGPPGISRLPPAFFPEAVLDLLTHLVEKSLVVFEAPVEGAERYRMLESIRQYGAERLAEAGETEASYHRHGDFFLSFTEAAGKQLAGADQSRWFARLDADHDNLRAVMEGENRETGLRIAGALRRFWEIRGHYREARLRLKAVLDATAGESFPLARSNALNAAGMFARIQGDYASARTLHEECLAISREIGNNAGIVNSLGNLGIVAYDLGDYGSARTLQEECLERCRQIGSHEGTASALHNLSNVAQAQDDYAYARTLIEESIEMSREAGDGWSVAASHNALGNLAFRAGDYASARRLLAECLTMMWELGDKEIIVACLSMFAVIAMTETHADIAVRLWSAVSSLREAMGSPLPPSIREHREAEIAAAREALGEEAFHRAWQEGTAMTMEQSIAYAVSQANEEGK